tara:strand:- start:1335 stop:2114 length:780 start_codon:yes stop_codon:yes gene_type:complete
VPSLVFVHGFLDEGTLWAPVMEHLKADGIISLAPDLPGMGALAGNVSMKTLPELAGAVIGVMDAHGRPAVLVGHSMGAQIAELVATERPHLVEGLILISPVPLGGMPVPPEVAAAMRSLGGDPVAQRNLRAQFAPSLGEVALDGLVEVGLKVHPAVVTSLFNTWSEGLPAGDEVSRVTVPTLLLGGGDDAFSTPELLESVVAPRFPHARLMFQAESGHWPHVEHPIQTAARINDFVRSLRPADRPAPLSADRSMHPRRS